MKPASSLQFSVIVCTRNRKTGLMRCLKSIQRAAKNIDAHSTELIVVDNGSSDGTAEAVTAFAATADLPVRLLREPRQGLSIARNSGMVAARAELLVFTDDDCELSPGYLRDAVRHFAAVPADTIRGGRVDLGDPADAPVTIRTENEGAVYSPQKPPGGFLHGCNMIIPASIARRVGLFDSRLGAGTRLQAGEDSDYLVRAHKLGIQIEYVPDMQVLHFHGRRGQGAVRRLERHYQIGDGALYAKHALGAPWLLRHLGWTVRRSLAELFGGPRYSAYTGQSNWQVLCNNLHGMLLILGRRRPDMENWTKPGVTPYAQPTPGDLPNNQSAE